MSEPWEWGGEQQMTGLFSVLKESLSMISEVALSTSLSWRYKRVFLR